MALRLSGNRPVQDFLYSGSYGDFEHSFLQSLNFLLDFILVKMDDLPVTMIAADSTICCLPVHAADLWKQYTELC